MSKYNPTQRARDLKRENSQLRSELRYEVAHSEALHNFLRDSQRIWTKAGTANAVRLDALAARVRNHRILSGALLVLAVAGWLV